MTWITIRSSLKLYHSWHVNWLHILLHVFIYFVSVKVIHSLILLDLWCCVLPLVYKLVIICLYSFIYILLFHLLLFRRITLFLLIKLINVFNQESGLSLLLIKLLLLFELLLRVKHTENRISSTHKIWMISINVRILNYNKVFNHLISWLQAFN